MPHLSHSEGHCAPRFEQLEERCVLSLFGGLSSLLSVAATPPADLLSAEVSSAGPGVVTNGPTNEGNAGLGGLVQPLLGSSMAAIGGASTTAGLGLELTTPLLTLVLGTESGSLSVPATGMTPSAEVGVNLLSNLTTGDTGAAALAGLNAGLPLPLPALGIGTPVGAATSTGRDSATVVVAPGSTSGVAEVPAGTTEVAPGASLSALPASAGGSGSPLLTGATAGPSQTGGASNEDQGTAVAVSGLPVSGSLLETGTALSPAQSLPSATASPAEITSAGDFRGPLLLAGQGTALPQAWLTGGESPQVAPGLPTQVEAANNAENTTADDLAGQVFPALLPAPEASGLATDAAAFDPALLERALSEFLNQLGEVERAVGGWLAQPASWVLMGMAVATVGAETWHRRRARGRNGLPLLALCANGVGSGCQPDGAGETV